MNIAVDVYMRNANLCSGVSDRSVGYHKLMNLSRVPMEGETVLINVRNVNKDQVWEEPALVTGVTLVHEGMARVSLDKAAPALFGNIVWDDADEVDVKIA